MKNFLLFVCFALSTTLTAQIDIVVTPNPVTDFETVSDAEVVGKAVIKNDSGVTKSYTWERTVMCGDGFDFSYFCDPNVCHIPATSSAEFSLEPGAEGAFDMHTNFSEADDRTVMIQVTVWETGNEANLVDVMYELESCTPLSIDETKLAEINLFPNPTSDYFTLSNTGDVNNIVVQNLLGMPMKQYLVTENTSYSIAELPNGIYLVQLFSNSGDRIGTKKIYKN